MSWKALIWAHQLRIGLTPFQKLTLMVLAEHADDQGRNSWPSVATIGNEAELSERTVQRSLRELVIRQVIVADTGGGRSRTTRYSVLMTPRSDRVEPDADAPDQKGFHADTVPDAEPTPDAMGASVTPFPIERVSASPERVSATTLKGASQTPEPVLNQSMNQGRRLVVLCDPIERPETCGPVELASQMWNELAAARGLSQANLLTDGRRKRIRQRLLESGGIEGWCIALQKVAQSSFLLGEARDFRASLDFILQQTSFAKLMESQYSNRQREPVKATGREKLREIGNSLRERMGDTEWDTI